VKAIELAVSILMLPVVLLGMLYEIGRNAFLTGRILAQRFFG
jgi:hypothetical protein